MATTKRAKSLDGENAEKISAREKEKLEKAYRLEIVKKIDELNTNGKITIAIFCDTFYPIIDGVITVMDNYAKRLNKIANVIVCVPKHKGQTVKKEYLVLGASSIYFKIVNYDLGFPQSDAEFNKIIKALRIDIIHIHSPFNMGSYAVKLAKKRKIPVVATFHSNYKSEIHRVTNSNPLTNAILAGLMKVFSSCDEVWTMHNGTKNMLIDFGYKNHPSTIKLLPNATDFTYPKNAQELIDKIDREYGLKEQQNVFLFVGRLTVIKNLEFLINALKILKDKGLDFKMIFVGNGPDEKDFKKQVVELELQNQVMFVGKISDKQKLAGFYLRSDLFLFPSICDMSSIVQIEAACHKTPVVFVENTQTAQTITNNVNGFTCKNDVNAFAKRVLEICQDKAKLKEISENAFEQIYVTWDEVVKEAYENYQRLIYDNHEKLYRKFLEKNGQKLKPIKIKKKK